MTELYDNRDTLEAHVLVALRERFERYGYVVESVLIDQPQPSPEVRDAFNRVIASVRLQEAARNEAEAERIRLVGRARAEAESKRLQGEGMARMREAVAAGLERSMTTIVAAGLTPAAAIAFLTDTNRLDTIASAAAHRNLVVVDLRAADRFTDALTGTLVARERTAPDDAAP